MSPAGFPTAARLGSGVIALALLLCPAPSTAQAKKHDRTLWVSEDNRGLIAGSQPTLPTRTVSFGTTEGTNMSVDVSPDGETLIFDLLGDIYSMPIGGGDAKPITSGTAWDRSPRYSTDGTRIFFISDRSGYNNLWQLGIADKSLRQVTHAPADIVGGPTWSEDGSRLLAGAVVGGSNFLNREITLQSINPDNGVMSPIAAPSMPLRKAGKRVRNGARMFSGVQSADGRVFYSEAQLLEGGDRKVVRLYEFNQESKTRIALTPEDADYHEFKPELSRDGQRLAYFRQYSDRRVELRIVNRETSIETAIALGQADDASYTPRASSRPNYAFTPDGSSVVFWHQGKIHRVNIDNGSMETIPFEVAVARDVTVRVEPAANKADDVGKATAIRWPSLSRDGQTMAFAAIGYVWSMDTRTGEIRRLTESNNFEYMPAISPNGRSVAYISFDKQYQRGRLMVVDTAGRQSREVLVDADADYLLPAWSDDGSMIAVIREPDRRQGVKAEYGWTSATTGTFHKVASASEYSNFPGSFSYARSVSFNAAGNKLLFTYPRSFHEIALVSADIHTGALQDLAMSTSEVGGIAPAPDLRSLALTRRDGSVWLIPFNIEETPASVSVLTSDARRVSQNAGYYLDWSDSNEVTFGFGSNIYRYPLDGAGLQLLNVHVPVAKERAGNPIAFTGARLITVSGDTGAGPVVESGTIIVENARIEAVGPTTEIAIPADAIVFDATGKTIIPGLLDSHYHNSPSGFSALVLPDFGSIKISDESAINYGVTSAWSPGGNTNDGLAAIDDLQAGGRIMGPRWSHSAPGPSAFPDEFLTSYVDALAAVEQHVDLRADVIKEYSVSTREQQQWLLAAAHENNLGIVSHLENLHGLLTRIVDGYTGGDHPHIPMPFYKDVREMLRQTGYIWTPNVAITLGTIGTRSDKSRFFCRAVNRWREQSGLVAAGVGSVCDSNYGKPTVDYDLHRVGIVARQVAFVASEGVRVGVSAHNAPGVLLHQEMWHLVTGGMPIEEVIRATTMVNAHKLGLHHEVGSLEAGKKADFLVLDGNPLDNILNTLSLTYTVQGGVVYESATAERADMRKNPRTQGAKTLP